MLLVIQPMLSCSIIIVTYNSAERIGACLAALASEPCEVIVVDNASQDDTVAEVKALLTSNDTCVGAPPLSAGFADRVGERNLRLLKLPTNLGFAAGVNHGAKVAMGDVLLVLNPDTIAEPGAVAALLDCLEQTGAAAAGGALLGEDGQPQRGFAFRRLPTLLSLLFEVFLINQLWPGNPVNHRYRCLNADYSRQQEVEQPAGACLAIRRSAFEAVGGFDDRFRPVWFEDVDFCERLLHAGSKIVYCPAARFRHAGGHSVSKLPFVDKQLFWYANMLRYSRKHLPGWKTWLLRIGIVGGMLLRSAATLVGKSPAGVSGSEARRAYSAVARKAMGSGIT